MDDLISSQTIALRRHLGLGEQEGMPRSRFPPKRQPLFFVERSPTGHARCKLATCGESIKSGQYRIALSPGMSSMGHYTAENADLYHVACLEKIADLSKADFLDRISPVMRSTYGIRKIKGSSILDGSYLCEGAVERLVLQWKVQRGGWIDESEGEQVESFEGSMPEFYELLQNAGSRKCKASGPITGMTMHEYMLLMTNLFDTFLSKDKESWHDHHDLSKMLTKWGKYAELAASTDDDLDEDGRELRAKIGEKGIRAIKRLSAIPMPDIQGMVRGY